MPKLSKHKRPPNTIEAGYQENGEIKLIIPGHPVGKERPRLGRNNKVFTPRKTTQYEQLIGILAQEARIKPILGQGVIIHIDWLNYKSDNEMVIVTIKPDNNYDLVPIKPDLDNVIKSILDGLEGYAYGNDNQISGISALVDATPTK